MFGLARSELIIIVFVGVSCVFCLEFRFHIFILSGSMLCCAVLCCAVVLCCVVLCCAVLCCVVLCPVYSTVLCSFLFIFLRDRHRVDWEIVAQEGHCPTRVFGGGGHVFFDDRRSNRGMCAKMYQNANDDVALL